jgi:tRNA (guanosine-2'-O-)-methyltransferase
VTPRRWHRLRAVLDRRQPDLTVLLDNVHKPHNFSAILRTCDAVGVLTAHAVWPDARLQPNRGVASGSGKWVDIRVHPSVTAAVRHLRDAGFQILAAEPAASAVDFRRPDYTRPTAILLGAELYGLSARSLDLADRLVTIPMSGMVQSLNVSVAAAVLLFEAQRQRHAAGLYGHSRLSVSEHARLLFEWGHPNVARYCRQRGIPYPEVDDDGTIVGPLADHD